MLHIRNILGIKFQLKLTILNFGSNSPKKGISTLKKEQINIEFYIVATNIFDFLKQFFQTRTLPNKNSENEHHY